jgi:hypothetical protein
MKTAAPIERLEPRRLLAFSPLDLTVFNLKAAQTLAFSGTQDGGAFDLTYTVANHGIADADSATKLRTWLSKDAKFGNADDFQTEVDHQLPEPLQGGEFSNGTITVSVPPGVPAGMYYLYATIDPDNKLAESVETNNTANTPGPSILIINDVVRSDSIHGTEGDDRILLDDNGNEIFCYINSSVAAVRGAGDSDNFDQIFVDGAAGSDRIVAGATLDKNLLITGSGGNDTIICGLGSDSVSGANGKDKIFGGQGNDQLLGAAGNDYLTGGPGDDTLSGAGGNDRLADVEGNDTFLGGAGNDVFVCRDGFGDYVSGGSGTDRAQLDESDGRASIEELLA